MDHVWELVCNTSRTTGRLFKDRNDAEGLALESIFADAHKERIKEAKLRLKDDPFACEVVKFYAAGPDLRIARGKNQTTYWAGTGDLHDDKGIKCNYGTVSLRRIY